MSSALDQMLKDLLAKNPDLAKEIVKKLAPADSKPQAAATPAKRKHNRPCPDYRLLMLSGCETCHTITESSYEMTWDEENRLFKPKLLCGKSKKAFVRTDKQAITTTTCSSCQTTLSLLSVEEMVALILLQQRPLEAEKRTVDFKRRLRALEKEGQ